MWASGKCWRQDRETGSEVAFLGAVLGLVVTLGGLGAALWAFQDRLIYFPDPTPPPPPALLGLDRVAETRLRTADGLDILAWSLPAGRTDAPVLLYLHDNGGSLAYRADRLRRFEDLGWGALVVQWRGYGGNPGQPSEAGLTEDARAGLRSLQEAGVLAARIVLWGESLGTGLAIRLAAEQPRAVAAVILESPYTSLLALGRMHYPLLPSNLLLRDRYDSLALMPQVEAPMLILQGARDTLVPPAMGREIAAAARAPVRVWEAPLAGHNELGRAGAFEEAARFLVHHLPGR
jgi:fermentation-respiration switch protein FrsA (DUF1100 family)